MLSRPIAELAMLDLSAAADRARGKMFESFPDAVRSKVALARERFRFDLAPNPIVDPRIAALDDAVRQGRAVRLNGRSKTPRIIHPVGLVLRGAGWFVVDGPPACEEIGLQACGDINIFDARAYTPAAAPRLPPC
jgi:predicted DNA-binding transcriptional regulator YafY